MRLEELAKKYSNALEGFTLVKCIDAASPIYKLDVNMTIQQTKELPIVQEFILKFLKQSVSNAQAIRKFLGLSNNIIYSAIAELQRGELITVDIFKEELKITEKGLQVLKETVMIVPEEITHPVYIDGLTNELFLTNIPFDNLKTVKNNKFHPLTAEIEKPTVERLQPTELNKAIKKYRRDNPKTVIDGELLSINGLEKVYPEYKRIHILVFLNDQNDKIEIMAFDRTTRVREYENVIMRMQNNNIPQIHLDKRTPFDEKSSMPVFKALIPKEIVAEAQEYAKNKEKFTQKINFLENQIQQVEEFMEKDDVSEQDKAVLTQQIRELKDQANDYKKQQNQGTKVLSMFEHRPVLEDALRTAKDRVVIVSPWIRASGLDYELQGLIEKAIQRGVVVTIGYGISDQEDSDPKIISRLKDMQKKPFGKNLRMVNLKNTHEKVLIADERFLVVTSFNWLSFKGKPEWGFRGETGIYTEAKDVIKQMQLDLEERMEISL